MTDVLTPEQRRRNMSAIRGADTRPERIVRSLAHRMGYRFRLHRRELPGKPDLVFPARRKAILVHGCFWHVHDCQYGRVRPATNADFWTNKRGQNAARDRRNLAALQAAGWSVLVVWECETRNPEPLGRKLREFLDSAGERAQAASR
ncbi:MAG: very short patch repair endonuclease [Bryobacteraceae bacterium]|jgi:DNA mismatch endonuclease (patch repair protein)